MTINHAALAEFLGEPYYGWQSSVDGSWCVLHRMGPRPSDDALFMALLLRAAEKGLYPVVFKIIPVDELEWGCKLGETERNNFGHFAPTPLLALAKAIEELK